MSFAINQDVSASEKMSVSIAIPFRGKNNIRCMTQNSLGVCGPDFGIVVLADVFYLHHIGTGVNFLQPALAQVARDALTGKNANQHVKMIDRVQSSFDEKLVASVGRIELSDDQSASHCIASAFCLSP